MAAQERGGAFVRRGEEGGEGGDRAVVQVGGAEPEAVEGGVGVAVGLAEGLEALGAELGVEAILVDREVLGVVVETGLTLSERSSGRSVLARLRKVRLSVPACWASARRWASSGVTSAVIVRATLGLSWSSSAS
jgi:hypothetical protein